MSALTIDHDVTFDEWATAGRLLATQHTGLHWTIGDWVGYGAERWADRWLQVAAAVGIPHATLAQAAVVARAFPPEARREGLSWSHHRAVCTMPADEASGWLDDADRGGWTVRQLEVRIREARALGAGQDELAGMPAKPKLDRSAAARFLAEGVTRVVVDLVTGEMEPA